jgi:hypothetical protein
MPHPFQRLLLQALNTFFATSQHFGFSGDPHRGFIEFRLDGHQYLLDKVIKHVWLTVTPPEHHQPPRPGNACKSANGPSKLNR